MSAHPERFEDLPPELQEKLTAPTPGRTRIHPQAQRAFGWAVACAAIVFFKWGGWIVAGSFAPFAMLHGLIALRAIRTETGWHGSSQAWVGLVVGGMVLVLVAVQVLRWRGLYLWYLEN